MIFGVQITTKKFHEGIESSKKVKVNPVLKWRGLKLVKRF